MFSGTFIGKQASRQGKFTGRQSFEKASVTMFPQVDGVASYAMAVVYRSKPEHTQTGQDAA
jgi:hypothetical protein